TVDVLSGGRHELGLGIGWMPEEFEATGTSMRGRGARVEEYIAVLHALWADGVSRFSGKFYSVPAGRADPSPVQPGGPPVLPGGSAPPALQRAGRLADGWIRSSRTDLSRIGEGIEIVHSAAEDAGRDPAAIRIICRGVVRAGEQGPGDGGRRLLSGSYEQI